jgi:hypothetical protein
MAMATPVAEPIHTTVVGVFDTPANARAAIDDLCRAGFDNKCIGFITPGKVAGELADGAQLAEGAGVGAAIGASIGGAAGMVAAAALLSPIGPAVVGGAVAAWLASVGAGAAAGSVLGALIGMGVSEEEGQWYESELKAGRSLVTVRDVDERAEEAREILRRDHGAVREPALIGSYGSGLPATPF